MEGMSLEFAWKLAVIIFLAGGTYTWLKSELGIIKKDIVKGFERAKYDTDGIGARTRNIEWERWKSQICMLAEEDDKDVRRWLVEQYLKR